MFFSKRPILLLIYQPWVGSIFWKKNWNFIVGQGQGQVQAQYGFQAQPGLQQVQVQVLCVYSTIWPENHLTW